MAFEKVVKKLQYVGKLAHYKLQGKNPELTGRCKNLEVACGMSRKVFRAGRSLTGVLRKLAAHPELIIQLLTMFGNSAEIVYWLLDHFTWLAKVGVLDPTVANTSMYVSALGESVAYIFFITVDVILIKRATKAESALKTQLTKLEAASEQESQNPTNVDQVKVARRKMATMSMQRVMWVMSIVARTSDLCIAMSVVDPNPFVSHTVTMGLSGLASALVGWYQQQWPD